jgi:hypothetical protein
MDLACILATSQATQLEVEIIRMQAECHEDGRFQSHGLTSWPKISKIFLDNLLKMLENVSVNWATHPKLNWEYVIIVSKKTRKILWPTPQPFPKK